MRAAASAGRPWVLDPVAAAASEFRMEACLSLLALRPAVVRGNASEILALASRSLAASSSSSTTTFKVPFLALLAYYCNHFVFALIYPSEQVIEKKILIDTIEMDWFDCELPRALYWKEKECRD